MTAWYPTSSWVGSTCASARDCSITRRALSASGPLAFTAFPRATLPITPPTTIRARWACICPRWAFGGGGAPPPSQPPRLTDIRLALRDELEPELAGGEAVVGREALLRFEAEPLRVLELGEVVVGPEETIEDEVGVLEILVGLVSATRVLEGAWHVLLVVIDLAQGGERRRQLAVGEHGGLQVSIGTLEQLGAGRGVAGQ